MVGHSKKSTKAVSLEDSVKIRVCYNWLGCVVRNFSKPFEVITKSLYINIVESQYLLWKPLQKTEGSWKLGKYISLMRERLKTNKGNNFEFTCHCRVIYVNTCAARSWLGGCIKSNNTKIHEWTWISQLSHQ